MEEIRDDSQPREFSSSLIDISRTLLHLVEGQRVFAASDKRRLIDIILIARRNMLRAAPYDIRSRTDGRRERAREGTKRKKGKEVRLWR